MRRTFILLIILATSSCAHSTGILPAGPDTYTVTERYAPVRGGGTEAQRVALTEANAYCTQQSREFVPITMNPDGPTGYSVSFKCLLASDPAVAKYQLERAPNLIIEERGK